MSKRLTIIVDADAIIALASKEDIHNLSASAISEMFETTNARVVYPATAIAESNAFIQRRLNSTASAYGTAVVFSQPAVEVASISQETLKHAIQYMSSTASKKHTLFDCIVAAVAAEYQADAIFSYDNFYKSKGFVLASELLEK